MSNPYGTPSHVSTQKRPTQPPLGPTLSTPHRSPFPSALRPSLFNLTSRPSPLSVASPALSPATALATHATYGTPRPLAAASRLKAPQNTPSSAYSSRSYALPPRVNAASPPSTVHAPLPAPPPGQNPYEALNASAFDSFVSNLTSSIRSALAPPDAETLSQRRKREREERAKKREEAQAERERVREREERETREEEERGRREREAREEDVFGEIRAVAEREEEEDGRRRSEAASNGGPYESRATTVETDGLRVEDFAHTDAASTYDPLPSDVDLRSTPAFSQHAPSASAEQEELVLSSSSASPPPASFPAKKPLFNPRAGSATETDEDAVAEEEESLEKREREREREGTWGAEEDSIEIEVEEQEQPERKAEFVEYAYEYEYDNEYGQHDNEASAEPRGEEDARFTHPSQRDKEPQEDDPSKYDEPFERHTRYGAYEEEERREEEEYEYDEDEQEQERDMQVEEEEQYDEPEQAEEEEKGPETIDLLDSDSEAEAGEEPEEQDEEADEEDDKLRSSPLPADANADTSLETDEQPSAPADPAETDLSDAQLEQQLSAEAKRHKALPRDTPDAPDRMVEVMEGTYPSFPTLNEFLPPPSSSAFLSQHDAPADIDDAGVESSRSPSPVHTRLLTADEAEAALAAASEQEHALPSAGEAEAALAAASEEERALVAEAHRHNALPRDTPDAPDRMVEEMGGSYPVPDIDVEEVVEVEDEDEEMLDVQPEGEGDADPAALADVETDGDGDGDGGEQSVQMESVEASPAPISVFVDAEKGQKGEERDEAEEEEGEFFGEGVPGDEVEMGREDEEEGQEVEQDREAAEVNPLEALYADESEPTPRLTAADKGKGRAPPTPSDQDYDDFSDGGSSQLSTTESAVLRFHEVWDPSYFETYTNDELEEKLGELVEQLERAKEIGSLSMLPIATMFRDAQRLWEKRVGVASEAEEEEEEGEEGVGSEQGEGDEVGEEGEGPWPVEADFDDGGEGAEGEVRMPSEMEEDEYEVAPGSPDRSAFDDEPDLPSADLSTSFTAQDDAALASTVSSMVDLHAQHSRGEVRSSELFVPTSTSTAPETRPLDSHFQLEDKPAPPLDSKVDLPINPVETSVDAPLESQERNQEETVEEGSEEVEQGKVTGEERQEEEQNLLETKVGGEQADYAVVAEQQGFAVVDDDEPIANAEPAHDVVVDEGALPLPPVEAVEVVEAEPAAPVAPSPLPQATSPLPAAAPSLPPAPPADDLTTQAVSAKRSPFPHPDPMILPASSLPRFHLSSHFQLEPGPAPAFDSRVRLDLPPTVTREIDAVDSENERDEGETRRRNGEETGEEKYHTLAEAVDVSGPSEKEAADVESAPAAEEGLTIVDDDEDVLHSAPSGIVQTAPPPAPSSPRKRLGATPPPPATDANATALGYYAPPSSVHIHGGVAPPTNPSILPPTLPTTPAEATPAPTESVEPSVEPEQEEKGQESEDFVGFGGNNEEEQEDASVEKEDEPSSDLPASSSAGVLGLPAGEEVEMGEPVQGEDDDEDTEEQVEEPKEEGVEEIDLVGSSDEEEKENGEKQVEVPQEEEEEKGRETEPSSEPIDYRTEDELELEAQEQAEGGEQEMDEVDQIMLADVEEDEIDQLASSVANPSSPAPAASAPENDDQHVHIHNVVEPGEWHEGEPIRFGDAPPAASEPQQEQETVLEEEPLSTRASVKEPSASAEPDQQKGGKDDEPVAVEMSEEYGGGEEESAAVQPTDVQSARGGSVETASELPDIAYEILDTASSLAASGRSASPTFPTSLDPEKLEASQQDAEQVEQRVTGEVKQPVEEEGQVEEQQPVAAVDFAEPQHGEQDEQPEQTTSQPFATVDVVLPSTSAIEIPDEQQDSQESSGSSLIVTKVDDADAAEVSVALLPAIELDGAEGDEQDKAATESSASDSEDSDEEVIALLSPRQPAPAPARPSRRKSVTTTSTTTSTAGAPSAPPKSPLRRSSRLPLGATPDHSATPASVRRTRSTTTKDAEEAPTPEPAAASSARRSSRLSTAPTPAPALTSSTSTSKAKRSRKFVAPEEPAEETASPAKRSRRSRPSRGSSVEADAPAVDEEEESPLHRVHHHHHYPAPHASGSTSTNKNGSAPPSSPPMTRSRCTYRRIRIRSRDSGEEYLFDIPSGRSLLSRPSFAYPTYRFVHFPCRQCALSSEIAQKTVSAYSAVDLGPVNESDHCEGVKLGGHSSSSSSAAAVIAERESALVPDQDVADAVRRIAGKELWEEGIIEVVPKGEEGGGEGEGGRKRKAEGEAEGTPGGKGRRRK
ncbi:hypothetical protein JCM8547_004155 [Rhodosporidiobolus lusitaniae]